MRKTQRQQAGSSQNPAQVTLSPLLSALAKEMKLFSEEHTEVSYETRKRVIESLQKLRQAIAIEEDKYRFPYLPPIQLSTLERARSEALLYTQAFHIEYDKLAVLPRLRRQRSLSWMFTECLEEGKRVCEAIKKEQEGATNEHHQTPQPANYYERRRGIHCAGNNREHL